MKLDDIITLAKAGYTPKQVKELLEFVETSPQVKETDIKDVVKEEPEKQPEAPQENKSLEDVFNNLLD